MNRLARSAGWTALMALLASFVCGCTKSYQQEVPNVRVVDPNSASFLRQFEGVWNGSTWGEVIVAARDVKGPDGLYHKLTAYLPNDPARNFMIIEPIGTVDMQKHVVSVTITHKHRPGEKCTSDDVTKWVDQLPKGYVAKTAEFISLNKDDLERWMAEQQNKFYELLSTSNSNGKAATGEPELQDLITQVEQYRARCGPVADSTENALLKNAAQTNGEIKPILTSDFGGSQSFIFVRTLNEDDKTLLSEKTNIAEVDRLEAESSAAASIIDAKLADLNNLRGAINRKNAEVGEWLTSYRDSCLKNNPPGSGRASDALHAAGEISGFDWRPAKEIVRICSGKKV